MKTLNANFKERSYNLLYGSGLIENLKEYLPKLGANSQILVIANEKLEAQYGELINKALADHNLSWKIISDGERNKNLETVYNLYREFSLKKIDKGSLVISFGGGVLQDIVTYTCATYRRGTPFVQIPTTVLSQADIGVGGCAVDTEFGKSLIGTFYQPLLAINDVRVLASLPKQHHINGYAEIICKVVCLGGETEKIMDDISKLYMDSDLLSEYIALSATYKKETIEKDEIGTKGVRIMLDYGHTITYALETISNYSILHGYALGIGMHIAATLSYLKGYLKKDRVIFLGG